VRFFQLCVTDLGETPVLEMKDDESTDVPPEEVNQTLIRVTCPTPGVAAAALLTPAASAAPAAAVEPAVVFQYSALSQTATIPVRELKSNPYFTRRLPERLKQAQTRSEQEDFGELWANYLIPEEFLRMIEASGHLTLVLDESTASFPWEMVAVRKYGSARFLGVDHQLARLFRTSFSTVPGMLPPINKHLRVLIIADPSPAISSSRIPQKRAWLSSGPFRPHSVPGAICTTSGRPSGSAPPGTIRRCRGPSRRSARPRRSCSPTRSHASRWSCFP